MEQQKITKVTVNGNTYQLGSNFSGEGYYKVSNTLTTEPTVDTKTYTLNGDVLNYEIGQVVRVADTSSDTGYSFYRLHDIDSNGLAIWSKLDTGLLDLPETVTVHVTSNQSSIDDLIGATITVNGESKIFNGSDLIFSVPEDTQYTVSASSVTGYATPVDNNTYTALFWGSREITLQYNTEIVTVTTQQSGVALYVNNVVYTQPVKIAYGETYTVTGENVSGYSVSSDSFTAPQVSRTVEVIYEEFQSGVWAVTTSGQLVSYANIDTSNTSLYVGVAVRDVDNGIGFFIDKRFPKGSTSASTTTGNYKAWSNALYNKDQSYLTNISTSGGNGTSIEGAAPTATREAALNAFKAGETGIVNTNNIVNNSNCSSETAQNNAAKYCRSIANPVTGAYDGYLGSLAEWIVVNDNQVAINQILGAIGGVKFELSTSGYKYGNYYYTYWWTSSECSSTYAWGWSWNNSYSFAHFLSDDKYGAGQVYCARPFFPLS